VNLAKKKKEKKRNKKEGSICPAHGKRLSGLSLENKNWKISKTLSAN